MTVPSISPVSPRFGNDNLPSVPQSPKEQLPAVIRPTIGGGQAQSEVIDGEVLSTSSSPIKPPVSKKKILGITGIAAAALTVLVGIGTLLFPRNTTPPAESAEPPAAVVNPSGSSPAPATPSSTSSTPATASNGQNEGIRAIPPVLKPGDKGYIQFVFPRSEDKAPPLD